MDIKTPIKNIEIFLNRNSNHLISVSNPTTGKDIVSNVSMQQIVADHEDIQKFFLYIKMNHKIDEIFVQKRKSNGTSKKNFEKPFYLTLTVKNKPLEGVAANGEHVNSVVSPNVANTQQIPAQQIYKPEVIQQNNKQMGLNAVQIANGIIAEERAMVLKEKVEDLKDDLRKQKKKTDKKENQIEDLVIKLRKAESDLANFETKMALEILRIEIDKKSSITPEMVAMVEKLAPALTSLVTSKVSAAPSQTTGLGASLENVSVLKQGIITYVSQDAFSEESAKLLDSIILGLSENLEYAQKITLLNQEYNIN